MEIMVQAMMLLDAYLSYAENIFTAVIFVMGLTMKLFVKNLLFLLCDAFMDMVVVMPWS